MANTNGKETQIAQKPRSWRVARCGSFPPHTLPRYLRSYCSVSKTKKVRARQPTKIAHLTSLPTPPHTSPHLPAHLIKPLCFKRGTFKISLCPRMIQFSMCTTRDTFDSSRREPILRKQVLVIGGAVRLEDLGQLVASLAQVRLAHVLDQLVVVSVYAT